MMNRWAAWADLLVATVANFRLFLSRWAERAYSPILPVLTDAQLSSLTVDGVGGTCSYYAIFRYLACPYRAFLLG